MFKKFLDRIYYIYEIISTNISFFSFLYLKFHEPAVKKEIKMADISKSDKILHIGCGAIPYTSIIISEEHDGEITGIDNQLRSITLANKLLNRLNLSKKIHIEIGAGETYNISNFDVIIMSYGIGKPEMVLRNVFENLKKDGKIILRIPITKKNDYIDSIIQKNSIKKIGLLLTQESVLIVKKDQKS